MYKLVKGTLEEIEALLNAAVGEGYSELFREFPPPIELYNPERTPSPPVYAFLMKKPSPVLPSGDAIRRLATELGFGDRLPPAPKDASVLDLVRAPTEPPKQEG